MKIENLSEKEYINLPLSEKQFYNPIIQWFGFFTWHFGWVYVAAWLARRLLIRLIGRF